MLKGDRCETAKCCMERQWRSNPPGMHGWRRRRGSETYAIRLREKQKVKRFYGVLERQFAGYFRQADRAKGNTGEVLLVLLERRLDNVVAKLGFAPSRAAARQVVSHGHICVNGRRLNRPGYLVSKGDVLSVKSSDRSQQLVRASVGDGGGTQQSWLQVDAQKLEGTVTALPTREDIIQIPVEENLIVEMCSR